jgi:hypothetical protein
MNQELFSHSVFDDMSISEKVVADFLTNNGIWWTFEQPVFVIDDKNRPRLWSPDFYLPALGMYIEVVGDNSADYSYREEIYRKNQIPVIFVYPNKEGWQGNLMNMIITIHQGRWELIRRFPFYKNLSL